MTAQSRSGAAFRLVGAIAVEAIAVFALHRLGNVTGFSPDWSDLGGWLATATPEEAIATTLRLVALVLAWWLLVTTVLYALGRIAGLAGLVRSVEWATLPMVRRLADRAAAVSLAVMTVAAPAVAVIAPLPALEHTSGQTAEDTKLAPPFPQPPQVTRVSPPGTVDPALPTPVPVPQSGEDAYTPTPAGSEGTWAPPLAPPARRAVIRAATSSPAQQQVEVPSEHVVVPGDNLWIIAERHLEQVTERGDLSDREVANYWVAVIEANRNRVRSGDPDLIYPGEVIVLPPISQGES
jgi:LysM domain